MDREAGWWTTSGNMGVGRQQQLSSVSEEETVEVIPGGDGGHSQEDERSLADAELTSDTLAYKGLVKTRIRGKGKYQNGWINMCVIVNK